ncbi:MAG TPA: protein kinase [Kofleriaceae bacterium]|nr:protein kinase [Kofleriaceae bacterium]
MGGQAAEQIIAGVVLSERLAVTMYGAIHRAQFGGQRNLRGLVVDPKMLAEDAFRIALTDARSIDKITKLDHPNIVPTVGVESGGPDVVVVTRGVGRYVTVQDLVAAAKARSKQGGKLSLPIAALIGKSVIEALAAAHKAGVIHGAVHPRSVLIDEDGVVRLGDFVVGRALTTAVAQGADSTLWRGLAGYIAPELVVGEDPTPGVDVFAVGAMLFAMLSGEVPPGVLRVTPAVERLVQRALDTDPTRRYRTASDLLENLVEAMEDDRWELAERGELIREAGLSASDTNIDEATEDLLASLGSAPGNVQVTPIRPGADLTSAKGSGNRLDALLADLDEHTGLTKVDDPPLPFRRDPISEVIKADPRRKEAIVSSARVPSLDDPDDETPIPGPVRDSHLDFDPGSGRRAAGYAARPASADEAAALAAIGDLDEGAKRVNTAAEAATAAAAKLEEAADRVERAAVRAETNSPKRARPIADPLEHMDLPPPRLKSPVRSVIGGLIVLGLVGGAGYMLYTKYNRDEADQQAAAERRAQELKDKQALEDKLRAGQPDPGAIDVTADQAGVWLRLGRTPLDTTIDLPASQPHDLVLLHDGNDATEAQVNGTSWTGAKQTLKASIEVALKPASKDKRAAELPLQPTTPVLSSTGVVGNGPLHIDSTPRDAEVWLFIGTSHVHFSDLWAGRDYELAVVRPGFKTAHVEFKADEWRDGGDPNVPIDVAKKKPVLSRTVELEPDPAQKPAKGR